MGVEGWMDARMGGMGVYGKCKGVPYTHVHMHAHTFMHMYKHDNFMQMAAPIVMGFPW